MKVPDKARGLIEGFEGFANIKLDGYVYPYFCSARKLTVGIGTTNFDHNKRRFTVQECVEFYERDSQQFLDELVKMSPTLETHNVSEARICALLSWIYNLGATNYRSSTMKKMVDIGEWNQVALECRKWNKERKNGVLVPNTGLTIRRNKEAELLKKGEW
jgi:lysozyme